MTRCFAPVTLTVVGGVVLASVALGVTPTHAVTGEHTATVAAKAATPRVIYFDAAPTSVTSSNGTSLTLTVLARYLTADSNGHVTVELATPGATGNLNTAGSPGDDHTWSYTIRGKQPVTLDKSGKATADFGTKTLGRFGSAHFAFTPKAKPEVLTHCDSSGSSQTTYGGSLAGSFAFNTGTGNHGWGVVKGSAKALGLNHHASLVAVYGEEDCGMPPPDTCPRPLAWNGGSFFGGSYDGDSGSVGFIAASRVVNLETPKKAQRIDVITRRTPVPTLATSGDTTSLTIATNGHGASGSATITATTPATSVQGTCGSSNETYTTNEWQFATLTNGAHPLHVNADLFSSLTASDSTSAGFSRSIAP